MKAMGQGEAGATVVVFIGDHDCGRSACTFIEIIAQN